MTDAEAGAPAPRTDGSGEPSSPRAIGIDIGGTGVKAGVVDLAGGELISARVRRPDYPLAKSAVNTFAR
jgi:predicted NBD/HSP70 family sugar kinase